MHDMWIHRKNTLFCLAATGAKGYCRMLRRGPKKGKSLLRIRKLSLLRRKSAILSVKWKFHCIAKIILALCLQDLAILSWSTLFWARIRSKKLICSLTYTHKGQKCIQILWRHQNKNFFFRKLQRLHDKCDPQGKYPIFSCSHRG